MSFISGEVIPRICFPLLFSQSPGYGLAKRNPRPFADAVRAGVGSVMCSYNQVNNSYACSNSYLMNKILKSELGFQGFVMTDWSAHHGGVSTVLAGLDMSMPGDVTQGSGTSFWGTNLTVAVLNGTIPEWRVDDMAVRIMAAYYKVGRDAVRIPPNFNSWTTAEYGPIHKLVGDGWGKVNDRVNVRGQHAQLIRRLGSASTVLLKNDGALPLTGAEDFVAILGEDAGSNSEGVNGCEDRSCDNGTLAMGWGSGSSNFPYLVTAEQAIQSQVLSNGIGEVISVTNNGALSQMAEAASQARCVSFPIALSSSLTNPSQRVSCIRQCRFRRRLPQR